MSYSGFNNNGGIHHCYTFYERMIMCTKSESLPLKMCNIIINIRFLAFLFEFQYSQLHAYRSFKK